MRQTLQTPAAGDWVRREVATSWRRCLEDYALVPPPNATALPVASLFDSPSDASPQLLRLGAIVAQHTGKLLDGSGLTLCLSDAGGRLLTASGQDLRDCPAGRLLTRPQADWSEASLGNNGLGSVAVTGMPVAFCGEEHFHPVLHPFATAGFPLSAADGTIQAVLGLLSHHQVDPGLLRSLVCVAGSQIEDLLFRHDFPQGVLVRFRSPAAREVPGSTEEALIIIDPQERILAVNHLASRWFGLRDRSTWLGRGLSELVDLQRPRYRVAVPRPASLPEQADERNLTSVLVEKSVRLQERRIPILIVGESGAGKEHLVRQAYEAGPRRNGPFIAVNCASLPRELIESELFGYAPGSFTGASREGKPGKFLLADSGVLFLDEIGDMSLDLQAVLLRVLENSEFFPIGATRPVRVDVQIFAATNVPIQEAVKEGRFRRDLYYRLNGAQLALPPLRQREDKLAIIHDVLRRECRLLGVSGAPRMSREVLDLFLRHPWPGNMRQLSNVIRSSLPITDTRDTIEWADLPQDFLDELAETSAPRTFPVLPADAAPFPDRGPKSLADWESRGIEAALSACDGNITQAARVLGITRSTLYKKIAQYCLGSKAAIPH